MRRASSCSWSDVTGRERVSASFSVSAKLVERVTFASSHAWIDWILGTKDVAFSGYQRDRSGFVRATSDHPIVVAQVKVTGKPDDAANAGGAVP